MLVMLRDVPIVFLDKCVVQANAGATNRSCWSLLQPHAFKLKSKRHRIVAANYMSFALRTTMMTWSLIWQLELRT
jgi:hypothetical protein